MIYKISKVYSQIDILVINSNLEKNYLNDYRIQFLQKKKIKIIQLTDLLKIPKSIQSLFQKSVKITLKYSRLNFFRLMFLFFIVRPLRKIFTNRKDLIDTKEFIQNITNGHPSAFIFDITYDGFYHRICKVANKMKIPTVAVPHGHVTFSNYLIWKDHYSIEGPIEIQKPWFYSHMIVENNFIRDRYLKYNLIDKSKIVALGSTRFSDEWCDILPNILPESKILNQDQDVLRILFLVSKPKFSGFAEEVDRVSNFISMFPNVQLVIKPHTRGQRFKAQSKNNIFIADNSYHSSQLIDWADLVLFTMTSVVYDALKKDKPILYMKCTHSNKLIAEQYIKYWNVECLDDLKDFIWKFKENPKTRTYSDEERELFCKDTIEPNGKDVLKYYSDHIVGLI